MAGWWLSVRLKPHTLLLLRNSDPSQRLPATVPSASKILFRFLLADGTVRMYAYAVRRPLAVGQLSEWRGKPVPSILSLRIPGQSIVCGLRHVNLVQDWYSEEAIYRYTEYT